MISTLNPGFADFSEWRPWSGRSALSCVLAILIALVIGIYWPVYAVDQHLASLILRPAIAGCALLLALVWKKRTMTWAEKRLGSILIVMCAVLLAPSLAATNPSRALADWIKLAILCVIALPVCRALRHKVTAETFGHSLIFASVIAAGLTVYIYISLAGVTMPTYESSRIIKGIAQRENIPLNPIAFTSVFSYICGMCLVRGNAILWLLGFAVFPIDSVLTGSRAPLAITLACLFIVVILKGLSSAHLPTRVFAWLVLVSVITAAAFVLNNATFKEMSEATEGRWDLWSVGWHKFLERPLLGFGFESWGDDLVSRLPGDYALTRTIAANFAGGYHNEYVTLLAEQGLVGFLPVMGFLGFLLWCSWKLAFRNSATWRNGQWALFACLFLILRAVVESPGLFGYAQEPADFLAFLFVAIVLSRYSVEEDFLRSELSTVLPSRGYRLSGGEPAYRRRAHAAG